MLNGLTTTHTVTYGANVRRKGCEKETVHYYAKTIYKSYRTHGIVKNKIESFSARFSIFYNSMSSVYDLSHAHAPRNRKLVAGVLLSNRSAR